MEAPDVRHRLSHTQQLIRPLRKELGGGSMARDPLAKVTDHGSEQTFRGCLFLSVEKVFVEEAESCEIGEGGEIDHWALNPAAAITQVADWKGCASRKHRAGAGEQRVHLPLLVHSIDFSGKTCSIDLSQLPQLRAPMIDWRKPAMIRLRSKPVNRKATVRIQGTARMVMGASWNPAAEEDGLWF
jgi:hypothetical protein